MATKKPAAKKAVAKKNTAIVKKSGMSTAKKKLGNAKAKPAVRKATKVTGDHWFAKLSKKAQAEYIKTHPNSKFAKGSKVKAVAKSAKKAAKEGPHQDIKLHKKADAEHHMLGKKINTHEYKVEVAKDKVVYAKNATAKSKAKAKLKEAKATLSSLRLQHKTVGKLKDRLGKTIEKAKAKAIKAVTKPTRKKYASDKLNAKNAARLARDVTTTHGTRNRPKPMKKATATVKKAAAKKATATVKKTAKKVVLKSGKVSLRNGGPMSAAGARASKAREVARKANAKKR